MTNLQAIQARLEPYEVSDAKLELLLSEQGLDSAENYIPAYQEPLIKALVEALWSLVSLAKEKDNGSENAYDVDALMELIKHYEGKTKPVNIDMTDWW